MSGRTVPFDEATLRALYPSAEAFVGAVHRSAGAAVEAGSLLPIDAATIVAEAEAHPPVP